MAGGFIAVGEYRLSKAEMINWRDKVTGKPMSAPMLRHTVEFGSQSVAVQERVADGTKIEDIHVTFNKGDAVILHVDEYTSAKGLVSCRGRLEKFQSPLSSGMTLPVASGKGGK